MLDPKFIAENADLIGTNNASRQVKVDMAAYLNAVSERKGIMQQIEAIRAEANKIADQISKSLPPKKGNDIVDNLLNEQDADTKRQALSKEAKALKVKEVELQEKLAPLEKTVNEILLQIPNLTYSGSPVGGEEASADIARGATPIRTFEFAPRDHITLMETLGMVNLTAGAKVAGGGFYYLMGQGALLEMALTRFAMDKVMARGYTPVMTPDVVRDSLMVGAGFVPRGNESNTYHLEDYDLNLIATSEITLVGMHADEVVELNKPIKYAGLSHCFRSERAHGSATRGIYRVHQFTKAEMVVICKPDEAEAIHLELRALEQEIFDALEIPYRVLEIATGDLGAAAYRKFDLEAWMPGRGEGGSWGEITSTSNCTTFQSRRLNIRYRDENGKLQYAATLNGTALSVCRAIIALIENHQQPDGSIAIPPALQPYMGGLKVIAKAA